MNIAIFTPNKNPYSETFIQAHKNYLKGNVFFYYGNNGQIKLEGKSFLTSKLRLMQYRLRRKLQKHPSTYINNKSVVSSLKHHNINVILVEFGNHAYDLLPILKESGLPFVVHFHGYDASIKSVVENYDSYKEVFALATNIIAVSRQMEHMLLDLGCPRDKLVYNVYGPQTEFEAVKPTFKKNQFISIGRFTDKKAPYYTIMAFNEVAKDYPEACLLLAGNGVLLNTCENLVKHYKLEKQVQFLGVITPERFRQLLSESLALVQHSITAKNGDMEGTPLAVLEGSVAGLPVIATKHAGIPDVIVHNQTGLLCNEHDISEMAIHMRLMLQDSLYARQLGKAGKQHVLSHFSLKRHISYLDELLESSVAINKFS